MLLIDEAAISSGKGVISWEKFVIEDVVGNNAEQLRPNKEF